MWTYHEDGKWRYLLPASFIELSVQGLLIPYLYWRSCTSLHYQCQWMSVLSVCCGRRITAYCEESSQREAERKGCLHVEAVFIRKGKKPSSWFQAGAYINRSTVNFESWGYCFTKAPVYLIVFIAIKSSVLFWSRNFKSGVSSCYLCL